MCRDVLKKLFDHLGVLPGHVPSFGRVDGQVEEQGGMVVTGFGR